jgi:(2Fe-2S) ferredoxin
MSRPQHHLFVCVNERPVGGKPSCGTRGGRELYAALQQSVGARPDLWGRAAVTTSGCLGPCFEGPTLVAYPDGTWYCHAQAQDAEELVEQHLVNGQVVTRLAHDFDEDPTNPGSGPPAAGE